MACLDIFDAFRVATEDLDERVYRTASYRSMWLNLINRSAYELGQGVTHSVFGIGNVEPTGLETWQAITLATGTGQGACANNWNDVEWGFDEDTFSPEMFQLRGPVICRKDLLFSHDVDTFLGAYVQEISKRAKRTWEQRYEAIHISLSRKAIAVADFEGSFADQAGLTGLDEATCELTQEMLEIVAQYLMEDGATTPDSNGFIEWGDAGPIFSLHIGMAASQRILRQNAELRQDYRYADPQNIIARLGANRVIGNFRHIINQRPRRYSFVGGTYTYIPPYKTATGADDATKGTKQIINPSWRNAAYEGADVVSSRLFTSQVPPGKSTFDGVTFPPASYMGEWKFVTGPDAHGANTCDDPLHHTGRHFAEFIHAAKPDITARFKHGYHIIFERCTGAVECVQCSS